MAETPPAATSNRFVPRAAQARILGYQRGRLGISAVPGSGKTQTLSHLAARLVRELTETALSPPSAAVRSNRRKC